MIVCSKAFYHRIPAIQKTLEDRGHVVHLPNCFDQPQIEDTYRGTHGYSQWKASMFKQSEHAIQNSDAILVLNYTKNNIPNYIGGATFLEMYDAFRLGRQIFLYNPIPDGMLKDEITGFAPKVVGDDLV